MKKILVVGANGFVGRQVLQTLEKSSYELYATSHHEDINPDGNHHFVQCDLSSVEETDKLLNNIQPHIIINAAALSAVDFCEEHQDMAQRINVGAVKQMAQYCKVTKNRLIHISTDFVFDGKTDQLYNEDDEKNPVNFYGQTKSDSEDLIMEMCKSYAIVRVVVVYGTPLPGQHSNIVLLVKNRLEAGEPVRVVNDQYRTPTYVGDIVKGIVSLLESDQNGIFHLCGKDYMSIADIAFKVAAHFGLDSSLIEPVSTAQMKEKTPRPQYSGLSIKKAQEVLNYEPLSFDQGLFKIQ